MFSDDVYIVSASCLHRVYTQGTLCIHVIHTVSEACSYALEIVFVFTYRPAQADLTLCRFRLRHLPRVQSQFCPLWAVARRVPVRMTRQARTRRISLPTSFHAVKERGVDVGRQGFAVLRGKFWIGRPVWVASPVRGQSAIFFFSRGD